MIGLIGVVLSLALLIFFAYRGINVLVLAPLCALFATLFATAPLLATYTQVFMPALGKYVITYFPLFLLGAIFGKLMDVSGAARAIAHGIVDRLGAQQTILAIVLACGILTYGGVSLFVVAFGVFPIAAAMFRQARVPKRLIPAAIALGSFTFTMTALPGTPAIQNAIPNPFFGTNAFAAPVLGTLAGLIMFGGGMAWLTMRARQAARAGEGYDDGPLMHPDQAGVPVTGAEGEPATDSSGDDGAAAARAMGRTDDGRPITLSAPRPAPSVPFAVAMAPIVVVIVVNYLLVNWVFPASDTGYLGQEAYGNTDISTVGGIWAIIVALLVACLLVLVIGRAQITDKRGAVNQGTMGSLLPIFNTASEVGYGAVIASLPAFTGIRNAVLGISGDPVINLAVAVNVLAGVTGSASGGMSIALQTLGDTFREQAQAQGISLELMHRVTAIASGGFDALPHNGAVITLLAITGLTHRQSYKDIGMVAVVIPVLALVTVVVLGSLVGGI